MERLTLEEAIVHAKETAERNYRGADFESIDYIDDDIKANCVKCAEEHEQLAEWLEELKYYKDLEEQGLLVRLPCKVGDTVYVPTRVLVSEFKITAIFCDIHGTYFYWLFYCGIYERTSGFSERDIGKTVFLTREEAEKKLEEMKAND